MGNKGKQKKKGNSNTQPQCPHVENGINPRAIKKLERSQLKTCSECEKRARTKQENQNAHSPKRDVVDVDAELCLCLKCGQTGCSRQSEAQHALQHNKNGIDHPIVVNLSTWQIWCYACDDELREASALTDCIRSLRKKLGLHKTAKCVRSEAKSELALSGSVKGLMNLGNTCFFNAVMQNLLQTPLLRYAVSPESLQRPRMLTLKEGSPVEVVPSVDSYNVLTTPLNCLYTSFFSAAKQKAISPRLLFDAICKRAQRFRGYQQQDSQELLRHLLDALKVDEIRRLRASVRSHYGGRAEDAVLKEHYAEINTSTFVDVIFGGKLSSTVVCQECHTASAVVESFLDLSLPIRDDGLKRNQIGSKRNVTLGGGGRGGKDTKHSDDATHASPAPQNQKPSKHQKKKMDREKRKKSKRTRGNSASESVCNDDEEMGEKGSQVTAKTGEEEEPKSPQDERQEEGSDATIVEGSEKIVDSTKQLNSNGGEEGTPLEEDPSVPTPEEEEGNATIVDGMKQLNLNGGEEGTPLEDASVQTPEEENANEEPKDDDKSIEADEAKDQSQHEEEEEEEAASEVNESAVATAAVADVPHSSTLSPLHPPQPGQFSLENSLAWFCAEEVLDGVNKFGCATCTKRATSRAESDEEEVTEPGSADEDEDDSSSEKSTKKPPPSMVYSIATKQLLLWTLPPVLTLHLKRFHQSGYFLRKVSQHVSFPFVLDVTSFCSSKAKVDLDSDGKVRYSLYGVVEHSGSLRSGHYTAYVKTRANPPQLRFVSRLPGGEKAEAETAAAAAAAASSARDQWYYVSDSAVRLVSPEVVSNSQAFLLFYERV